MNSKKYVPLQVFIIFLAGLLAGKFGFSTNKESVGISLFNGKPSKLQSVINLIDNRYVDPIDIDSLTELIIPEIFLKLDPHTKYYSSDSRQQTEKNIKGQFYGIGLEHSVIKDSVVVISTIENSPCSIAGILPGDVIVSVDSVLIQGKKCTEVFQKLISGSKGTSVKLAVKRQGVDSILHYNVVRKDIPLVSVPAAFLMDSLTGYVKITSFGEKTYREFLNQFNRLKQNNIKNLIVDLRDNGGGLVVAARDIVSELLLPGDTIVYTIGRNMERDLLIIDTVKNPLCKDLNVVCLTNYGTASASEIFSGALQDNDRAVIMGRRTFGKGLVQTPISLSDNSLVRLTTSRYYTSSGRTFQKKYEDYRSDYNDRLKNGELDSANAYKTDTSKVFFTKNGRKVYSGGGVMPDFFVPEKKSENSFLLYQFENLGLYSKFAARKFNFHYKNSDILAFSVSDFVDYLFEDEKKLTEDFLSFATYCGVKIDVKKEKKELLTINSLVLNKIKAYAYYVAKDKNSFYKYLYLENPDLDSAISLFQQDFRFDSILKR